MQLRLVLGVTYVEPEQLPALARLAERLGFAAVALADHVAVPGRRASRHDLADGGRPLFDAAGPWPDAMAAIAAMGAVTRRLRFLTRVVVLPLHHPLALARAAATVSALSGGRLDLGVGVGWMREEFEMLGADWAGRGARADEVLEILDRAWRGPFEHRGRCYTLGPVEVTPRPRRPIPIYVGGDSQAALRRAARAAAGYLSRATDPAALAGQARRLRGLRAELGRADQPFDLVARAGEGWTPADVRAAADAGATSLLVVPWGAAGPAGPLARKRSAIERWLSHFPDLEAAVA